MYHIQKFVVSVVSTTNAPCAGDVVEKATLSQINFYGKWRNGAGTKPNRYLHDMGRLQPEDAVIMSERLVKDDVYTSVHPEE